VESALNLEFLALALGEHPPQNRNLPTPSELQALIADTEIRLFAGRPAITDELVQTAWYLHGVASVSGGVALYGEPRQRRAFQTSAHVFDLALHVGSIPRDARLRFAFAAEVGYHRGELQPNAMAVWRRVQGEVTSSVPLLDHVNTLALEAGVGILGLGRKHLYPHLKAWRRQLAGLRAEIGVESLAGTMFGASQGVVDGVYWMLQYLTFGDRENLQRSRQVLTAAVHDDAAAGNRDARWVAAHLRNLTDEIESGSIWTMLPPDLPRSAYQALTLTDPPILTLWPPQQALLRSDPSPLDTGTKRVVLSLPTSAGKTLVAQLLVVGHLAKAGTSVCYVAPLRSLGREVRRALRSRLAPLRRELGRDWPDFFAEEAAADLSLLTMLELEDPRPDVEIMTPERLAHLLRNDAQGVLNRFGLFIFDEAHLLGESGRGFTLEGVLSFLHWRTLDTDHRLVLLSAAMGNRGQLMTWIDSDGSGLLYESEWRGPRRLNAIYSTSVDWDTRRQEPVRSSAFPKRHLFPLHGEIRIRPAENARVQHLALAEPVGEIAFRVNAAGVRERTKQQSHSTPMYRGVARLAVAVRSGGSVLIVNSTRDEARRMAAAIAELLEDSPAARPVAEFVRLRVGMQHPLAQVIQKGVAYHHAALPIDVLEAIEEAVRDDIVQFVSSTTSLTEGVNLPVRTVIIAETTYQDQPVASLLRGARLLNAIGRAGRACKECEGWAILVSNTGPEPGDFSRLNVGTDELNVQSRLTDEETLHALADLDDALRTDEDAIFAAAAHETNDFVAFVWFILASEEERGTPPTDAEIDDALRCTLGYVQLDAAQRRLLLRVAAGVRRRYVSSDSDRRKRWARYGTSIGSGRLIDSIADELVTAAARVADASSLDQALRLLEEVRAFDRLYEMSEAPRPWRFRQRRSGPSASIEPPLVAVLQRWIHGSSMTALADQFLREVDARDYRIEQMVDATSQHFEHYLAWTTGCIVDQVNRRLQDSGHEHLLCPNLPLFVRYGVDSPHALELLTSGFRSREMAKVVADRATQVSPAVHDLQDWLRAMSIRQWHELFAAAPSDLLDLLEYTRIRRGDLLPRLLEDGRAVVELDIDTEVIDESVVLESEAGPQPAQLIVRRQDQPAAIARIPTRLHADVHAVLEVGLELSFTLNGRALQLLLVEGSA
jgi:hypothetical protein